MRIRVLAWITFLSLLRNKLIVLIFGVFLCIVLLMSSPLLAMKSMTAENQPQAQAMAVNLLSVLTAMVSGFGSLLAAWAAADAVASEMKSGTILAVLARPVRRWEFLLAKYCGVLLFMAIYVAFLLAVDLVFARIAGQRIVTAPWLLVVYPMVRYSIYAALAMWLVTAMHPVFAFVLVMFAGLAANLVSPESLGAMFLPQWLRSGLFYVLPSLNLLSEERFLAITAATLKQTPWQEHAIGLAHGLDYALVGLLLAAYSFRRRSLARE
jgi:ABC-type transport system involved in multi-copper enzyme maturation permease subunit